ncbi:hypothetical protein JL101_030255 (plasmid) [Skermanella rosea]|uniref:hypothetical protein n=1 Tax=Skermanella rosea TaxID=1817965 RepID=UPI0019333B74|nr:hypothetical protein [Skermanella rosea]UEM06778.1 hypothetical protein JL101_030255 [Skermanella rosea]
MSNTLSSRAALRFNIAFVSWCALFLVLGAAGFAALASVDRLPAPPITATNCIDEKFKFLHETTIRDPDLLAVGSSVTWRNLDFSVLKARYGDAVEPLNAAPCYLHVDETAFLTGFLLDNMPSVKTVLSVFSMRDFEACSAGENAFFRPEDARDYVFGGSPGWHLYFKNFRPGAFLRDALTLADMRSGENIHAPLVMDAYGSGPLLLPEPDIRENVSVDPACLRHLRNMSKELSRRGVEFVVVLLPPMPGWIAAYDPGGFRDGAFRSEVSRHLERTGALLIDAAKGLALTDKDFTDPAHLQWTSVPAFMDHLISQMDRSQLDLAGGEKHHAL